MEALFSARFKNISLAGLALALAAAALYSVLWPAAGLPPHEIRSRVEADCLRLESILDGHIRESLDRSEKWRPLYDSGRLSPWVLERREALLTEENGVVARYVGEIYFFRALALRPGDWGLIRKNQDLYFLRRIGPHTYYIRFLFDIRSGLFPEATAYRYTGFELKFAARPLAVPSSDLAFDQARQRYFYTRILNPSQDQLVLTLIFSEDTFVRHARRSQRLLLYGLAFLFFLALFLGSGREGVLGLSIRLLALAGMAFASWWGMIWLGGKNIYFPGFAPAPRSLFQLLGLCFPLLLAVRLGLSRLRLKSNLLALAVFNAGTLAAFWIAGKVMRSCEFAFGDFAWSADYVGLLTLLIGLFAAPLLAAQVFMKTPPGRKAWPLALLQAALCLAAARGFAFSALFFFLLAASFFGLLLKPRWSWLRLGAPLLLLALAVSFWLGQHSLQEKRTFISENLMPIFSSQNHYAKLVAREIVSEINSRNVPLAAFFNDRERTELADCWKNTLAARESIASGIAVVSSEGSVLRTFSYQIPYIPLKKEDIFPFWHVENVDASLFGKRVRLAVATINVFQKERYLGYIMVQVLNSAELILKRRERRSILDMNRRIGAAGLGYVKLDEKWRILENPLNINLQNLPGLMKPEPSWLEFRSMGLGYSGFIFRDDDGTSIIFFPKDNFFKAFSEFVKIMVFLLALAALFNVRRLVRYPWRQMFASFSMKVFVILLLLSMLTAAVFSLFSLNFNASSQEARLNQAAYRRGRSAMSIINNMLAGGGEITQDHLYFLEKVLENDISVYENGTLLYTSDHRKIIRSELPIYLNSGIRQLLTRDNQSFELRRSREGLNLNFRTEGDYIFEMEFPFDSAEQLRAQRYYVDFIVTLFFTMTVIGLAAAAFFRNQILAPIHRLNRGMADVQQGDLRPLADIPAESELRELYLGFNSMLQGIQEQKANASEISRMKTLVQLGRRVAHEVKNPLTPIRLSAEQILRSLRDRGGGQGPVIANAVRYIIEETEHLRRVAFGFLNLSKLDELKPEPFLLNELIAESAARLRDLVPGMRFVIEGVTDAVAVVADRRKIKQAIDNVLTNALEAVAGRDGEISIMLLPAQEEVEIRISDNGPGIAPGELERILSEEFSSKDLGTGLGLVIARRFLELHHGRLDIRSTPAGGTTVTMRFARHAHPA
jgi:signal transduction histidine kinase